MTAKRKKIPIRTNVNFWGMMQNVIIHSINKGQLPFILLFLLALALVIKLPVERTQDALEILFAVLVDLSNLGWVIAVLLMAVLFFGFRMLRSAHTEEVKRMAIEKRELQELLTEKQLGSSNI